MLVTARAPAKDLVGALVVEMEMEKDVGLVGAMVMAPELETVAEREVVVEVGLMY